MEGESLFNDEVCAEDSSSDGDNPTNHGLPRRDIPVMVGGQVMGKSWGPIPRFRRAYKVFISWGEKKVYKCSCCTQERMGFPCRHIACVLAEPDADGIVIQPGMKGFPVCSIRVFWWSHYYKFGMLQNPEYNQLVDTMRELDGSDTQGILCKGEPRLLAGAIRHDEEVQKAKDLLTLHPAERLLNYTSLQGYRALGRCIDMNITLNGEITAPPGYSQLSHLSQNTQLEAAQREPQDGNWLQQLGGSAIYTSHTEGAPTQDIESTPPGLGSGFGSQMPNLGQHSEDVEDSVEEEHQERELSSGESGNGTEECQDPRVQIEFGQLDASQHDDREDPWLELDEPFDMDHMSWGGTENAHEDPLENQKKEREWLQKLYLEERVQEETSDEESCHPGQTPQIPWQKGVPPATRPQDASIGCGLDRDIVHPRNQLVGTFNTMCDAISMSDQGLAPDLVQKAESHMNEIIALAHGQPDLPQTQRDRGGDGLHDSSIQ